jgi:diacylglycerol O-acyltransferase / wax synthase
VTAWGTDTAMNELEATMWRGDRPPENSTQGGVLQVLASTPEWSEVVRLHEAGVARFRRFRQRVLEPALPVGSPVWVDDEHFDLAYHLRRVRLPEPGSMRQLLDCAQALGATPLPHNRALWAGTFIEGLEDGRSAYFLTVHHCLMDGHASVQLMAELQRLAPGARGSTSTALVGRRAGNPVSLTAEQAFERARSAGSVARRAIRQTAKAVTAGPRENLHFVRSIGRVLAPPPPSGSTLMNSGRRASWRYGVLDCGLAELKTAAKATGGTVNDAYVAAVLGGLHRYHKQAGEVLGDITVNIPVSVRRAGDPEGGNRFATAFVSAPASVADPRERIRRLGVVVADVRQEPALDFFSLLLPALNRVPATLLTPLFIGMQNRADLTVSNVAGIPHQVRFLGVAVEATYYFGPLPGSAVMSVLHSQNERCFIAINCDGDVFSDPEQLIDCIRGALDEVLALGVVPEPANPAEVT